MGLINIGGDKLVFKNDIVGVFEYSMSVESILPRAECLGKPPYKACVILADRVYYTTLSVRTLSARLKRSQMRK